MRMVAGTEKPLKPFFLRTCEGFKGWGGEDFDFARRAQLDGHNVILNINSIGYHLDHDTINRDKTRLIGKGYFNQKWS